MLKPLRFVRAIRFSLEVLFIFTAILILLAYRCALTGNRVRLIWAFSEAYPVVLRKSFGLAGCTMLGEPATSQYGTLVWLDSNPFRGKY